MSPGILRRIGRSSRSLLLLLNDGNDYPDQSCFDYRGLLMNNLTLSLVSDIGMLAVGSAAVIYWRWVSKVQLRWFWVGAGLWTVAVALKVVCALLTNKLVIGFLKEHLPHQLYVVAGAAFVGIQSSLFEIGLTLLAVLIWKQLGRDANRAIGIGVGAGAFEALVLGLTALVAVLACLSGVPGTERIREAIEKVAAATPLFWLLAPVERSIAILCHASSRALVLLGVSHRRPAMVVCGFLIFTMIDGIAGAAHLSGVLGKMSMWWIELALLPFAVISVPVLCWCYRRWETGEQTPDLAQDAP